MTVKSESEFAIYEVGLKMKVLGFGFWNLGFDSSNSSNISNSSNQKLQTRNQKPFLAFLFKKQLVKIHSRNRIKAFYNLLVIAMNINMKIFVELDHAFKNL